MNTRKPGRLFVLACATIAWSCSGSPSLAPSALAPAGPSPVGFGVRTHEEVLPVEPTTINIIGSVGTGAFMPNPLAAGTGSMLVWKNDDLAPHHIVLADGTEVGTIGPGESTAPIAMSGATVGYYCTFHPSMTGVISDPSVIVPETPPDYYAPPADDPYDYDY